MDRWTVQSLADNVDNGAAVTIDDGDSECDDNDVFWSEAWLFHKHSGALILFHILLEMATTQKDDGDNDEKLVVPRTQKQSGGSHGSKTAHEYALPWTQSPTA